MKQAVRSLVRVSGFRNDRPVSETVMAETLAGIDTGTLAWRAAAWSTLGAGVGHAQRRRGWRPIFSPIRPGGPPMSDDTRARMQEELELQQASNEATQRLVEELVEAQTPATCDYMFSELRGIVCPLIRNHRGPHAPWRVLGDGRLRSEITGQVIEDPVSIKARMATIKP